MRDLETTGNHPATKPRRRYWRVWLPSVLAIAVVLALAAPDSENPPNILLITADDMSWDSVGVYGSPVNASTPSIDRLAAQGAQFDHAYVPIALCTPSRQVILSGSHSHQTMTRGFTALDRPGPALPDLLKEHGYFLANINKLQKNYDWDLVIGEGDSGRGRNIPFHHQAVRRIIETAGEQPWFIMANFNDPHRPFHGVPEQRKDGRAAPAQYSEPSKVYHADEITVPGFLPDLPPVRTELAQYYSSVRRADDGVGAVLAALKESGESSNTIVVFLSDHGISAPFAKLNCYPASLRVPLLIRYPGRISAGLRERRAMVSTVDLAPTLIELAGFEVPTTMAGRSFVPLLEGHDQSDRDFVVGYYYRNVGQTRVYPEFAVHSREWSYIYNPWVDGATEVHNSDYSKSDILAAMRSAAKTEPSIRERLDFHRFRVLEELYDIRTDPHALHNVANAPENAARLAAMKEKLVAWMEETDHPAAELMSNPYDEQRIAQYLAWETETAVKQIAEKKKRNKKRGFGTWLNRVWDWLG